MKHWLKFIVIIVFIGLSIALSKSTASITIATISTSPKPSTQETFTPSLPAPLYANSTTKAAQSPLSYDDRLIDIRTVNSKIMLDIRYATTNNFLKTKLYPVARCVLRGAVAKKLSQVEDDLVKQGLGLKTYDCYRPLSVQKLMWQMLPDSRFVANPATGSRHNRGAAVDITLVDRNGKELEMPSGFDDFTERAYRDYNGSSLQSLKNRQLLENVMKKYGFIPLATEWWHFDAPDSQRFSILDIPFGAIP